MTDTFDETILTDLEKLDDHFVSAGVEKKNGVPDGHYKTKVVGVKLSRTKTYGHPILYWKLKILDTDSKDRCLRRYHVIATAENVKWLKKDLKTCELRLEKLSELPNRLDDLVGIGLEVTKRSNMGFENVYINRRIIVEKEE